MPPDQKNSGFSLIEILIAVLVVALLLSLVGYQNITATGQKQKLIDTAIKVKLALEEANNQSLSGSSADATGNPSTWGVYLVVSDNRRILARGPFNATTFKMNSLPSGTDIKNIPDGITLSVPNIGNPPVNPNGLVIIFSGLKGIPTIYRANNMNTPVSISTWPMKLVLELGQWENSVSLDQFGKVTLNPIQKKT
jgi:prepilin-type N-terminal cleavage/methylation domain-containing protein